MRGFTSADGRAALLAAALGAALALVSSPATAESRIAWGTVAADGFREARETGRPVLAYVTGTPCGTRASIGGNPGDVHETDCERFEMRTVSDPGFVEATGRFVPLLLNLTGGSSGIPADADLMRRWKIGTIPTLLVADPWGNEILRLVGPTPPERAVRVLRAMPPDLRPLRAAGETLAADPSALTALVAAAGFYEQAGLRPVAERYYESAAGTDAAKADPAARQSVVVPRGLNLLVMGKTKEAARVFSDEAARGLDGPQSDAVLFGWAMAALASGDKPKAAEVHADLAKRFPSSPYTRKLAENLGR